MSRYLKTFLLLLSLSLPAGRAMADPLRAPASSFATTEPSDSEDSFNDGYVPPDLDNISKLYWAIGKFDINDPAAIDGFLAINECNIYQKYYHNDLQWNSVRDAARQKIMREVATFPTRFEIVIPIKLGRYDTDKRQFEVTPETSLNASRKFDVANNANYSICGLDHDLKGYPRNFVLLLNRPFDFKILPVNPELADLFINDTQKQLENTPLKTHVANYERDAYLRMRVHIVQYKEEIMVGNGYLRALVFGRLDGFEVYADAQRDKLLYKQDIKDDKIYHHVRETGAPAAPAADLPPPVKAAPVVTKAPAKVEIPAYQPPGGDEGTENVAVPDTVGSDAKPQ